MKEVLHDIVKSIIGEECEIEITERQDENGFTVLKLSVPKESMGKVIGRKGKIAKAIRTVMKACASRQDKKVSVEII